MNKKVIELYKAENPTAPLVILNNYRKSGGEIYKKCKELLCPDFSLAEISGLDWYDDMSPWAIPPISQEDTPCGGKADEYLCLLLDEIIPYVKSELGKEPSSVSIAGYSLAGLFALYSAFKCDTFKAVVSASGSMWFPGFVEFVKKNNISRPLQYIYFSLGDKEAHTGNPILNTVEENTKEICGFLANNGIETIFEMNKGNHFRQGHLRTAKGIKWILERI